jgi:hypothetical protein
MSPNAIHHQRQQQEHQPAAQVTELAGFGQG